MWNFAKKIIEKRIFCCIFFFFSRENIIRFRKIKRGLCFAWDWQLCVCHGAFVFIYLRLKKLSTISWIIVIGSQWKPRYPFQEVNVLHGIHNNVYAMVSFFRVLNSISYLYCNLQKFIAIMNQGNIQSGLCLPLDWE